MAFDVGGFITGLLSGVAAPGMGRVAQDILDRKEALRRENLLNQRWLDDRNYRRTKDERDFERMTSRDAATDEYRKAMLERQAAADAWRKDIEERGFKLREEDTLHDNRISDMNARSQATFAQTGAASRQAEQQRDEALLKYYQRMFGSQIPEIYEVKTPQAAKEMVANFTSLNKAQPTDPWSKDPARAAKTENELLNQRMQLERQIAASRAAGDENTAGALEIQLKNLDTALGMLRGRGQAPPSAQSGLSGAAPPPLSPSPRQYDTFEQMMMADFGG